MVARPVLIVLGLAGSAAPAFAWTQPADALPTGPRLQPLDRAGSRFPLADGGSDSSPIGALFSPGSMMRPPPRPTDLGTMPAPFGVVAGSAAPLPAEFSASPAARPVAAEAPPVLATVFSVLPPPRPGTAPAVLAAAGPGAPLPSGPGEVGLLAAGAVLPPRRPFGAAAPAIVVFETQTLPPARPASAGEADPIQTASLAEPPASPAGLFTAPLPAVTDLLPLPAVGHGGLDDRIAYHARLNEVPADLVHRVVIRESKYNPRAVGRGGALGLMQIKHATARALGYGGPAKGLLDAETNLTYAVKYLAGAYRTASGNYDRAVAYYARGYYYAAKRLAADEVPGGSRSILRGRASRSDVLAAATPVDTERTADIR